MNKRETYFDYAKAIGIFFVVLGHIEYISDSLRGYISSFHMPLFFLISGMLIALKNETEKELKPLIKKKFTGIIVPYLWFSLAYFFVDILNVVLHKIDMNTFIKDSISSVTFYGMSVLWFLPALFIGEVVTLFIVKKTNSNFITVLAVLILGLLAYFFQIRTRQIYDANEDSLLITTVINFFRVFIRGVLAAFFVALGLLSYRFINFDRIKGFLSNFIIGIVLIITDIVLCKINGCVDFHYIILKNLAVFFICAISGTFGIVFLSKALSTLDSNKILAKGFKVVSYFGRNSLIIMATHLNFYILYAALLIAWQIDTVVTRAKSYVFLFNIMFFTFLIEVIVIEVINRFFPFVLGKKK